MAINMINRVLLVGLGSIGKRHLMLARELLPNADIRVLRHQFTSEISEYSNGNFYEVEHALDFCPQVAIIANPAPFHLDISKILAEKGAHLLIEKPLSVSIDGVSQLIEICQTRRLILMTGYNLRFFSSLQYYKKILDDGIAGKTLSVRCEIGQYLPIWRPDNDYRQGVSSRHELGGGALLELSHELDYLRWIFGEVDWVEANLSRQSNLEIDVEDSVHLTLGFLPGLDGNQLIGTANLDFIRHDTVRLCVAIGEKGSLRWNGLTGEVDFYEKDSTGWRTIFCSPENRDDSYRAEWNNFLRAVSVNEVPMVNGEDGLKVLEIIEAARSSNINDGARFYLANLKPKKAEL